MKTQLLVLVATLAVTAAACGGADGDGGGGEGGNGSSADCADLSADDPFTIRMIDNAFEPSCFTASSEAAIRIVNDGSALHTFTIRETDVDVTVQPGETFSGASAGLAPATYDLACTLHPEMTGTIEVV